MSPRFLTNTPLQIPICVYHGTPEERAELRADVLSKATSPNASTGKTQKPVAKKSRKSSMNTSSPRPAVDKDRDIDPTPVFLTTYEMIIRDRTHLAPFEWRYIIVDEGWFVYFDIVYPSNSIMITCRPSSQEYGQQVRAMCLQFACFAILTALGVD